MSKPNFTRQNRPAQKQPNIQASPASARLTTAAERAPEAAQLGVLQTARLGVGGLPARRQRSLAAQIASLHGNRRLQRALAGQRKVGSVIQRDPLPRADLGPRSSGRAFMLDWDAVHRQINQDTTLRAAFQANLSRYLQTLFGEAVTSEQVSQRIARFETEGNAAEAQRARANLAIANQYAVVDTLDVEHSQRYLREGSRTFCNIYGYDVVTAMGGYIPRVWWTNAAIRRIRAGENVQPVYGQTVHELNANALTDWMHAYGGEFGWRQAADINAAQESANTGALTILLAARTPNPETGAARPGHINIIMPELGERQAVRQNGVVVRPLQSQAGGTNFAVQPHRARWWEGASYVGGGAWIYEGTSNSPLLTPDEMGGQPSANGAQAPQPAAEAAATGTAPQASPAPREEQARAEAAARQPQTESAAAPRVIQMPEMEIVGDPNFYSRAERLNRHYAAHPPLPGWPYTEPLRVLWTAGNLDDFADRVQEIQERSGLTGRAVDGILGPATARILTSAGGGESSTAEGAQAPSPTAEAPPASAAAPETAGGAPASGAPAAFPGRIVRRGERDRGYQYGGGRSQEFMTRRVNQEAERFTRENFPQKATACRVFLNLAPMEGFLSAINTWDGMTFTWGAGFAYNGMLGSMWRFLDSSVKSYLASDPHAGRYFTQAAMNITNEIRMDADALNAVVYVSENDPYREFVFQAQLQTFLQRTMGVPANAPQGENFAIRDIPTLSLAAHLEHWLPAFFNMPGDLDAALALSGGTREQVTDPAAAAIALTRIHASRMLDHNNWGRDDPDRRRVLKDNKNGFKVISHYSSNLRKLFDTRRAPLEVTSQAVGLVPSFQRGSDPFFTSTNRLDEIPAGHYVLREGNRFYDFGARP